MNFKEWLVLIQVVAYVVLTAVLIYQGYKTVELNKKTSELSEAALNTSTEQAKQAHEITEQQLRIMTYQARLNDYNEAKEELKGLEKIARILRQLKKRHKDLDIVGDEAYKNLLVFKPKFFEISGLSDLVDLADTYAGASYADSLAEGIEAFLSLPIFLKYIVDKTKPLEDHRETQGWSGAKDKVAANIIRLLEYAPLSNEPGILALVEKQREKVNELNKIVNDLLAESTAASLSE